MDLNSGKRPLLGLLAAMVVLIVPGLARGAVLDELLAEYRALGLRVAPADARLVFVGTGSRYPQGKPPQPLFVLAFLVGKGAVLVGPEEGPIPGKVTPIEPSAVDVTALEMEWHGSPFGLNGGLGVAIQLWELGQRPALSPSLRADHRRLAQALLAESLKHSAGHGFSSAYSPARSAPATALGLLAVAHVMNELGRGGTDRKALAGRMARALRLPGVDQPARRAFLQALERSPAPRVLAGGPSATTPVPALLDALADEVPSASTTGTQEHLVEGPIYRELVRRGFLAVPFLLDRLDDDRLTRHLVPVMNNSPPRYLRLGERVGDLVQGLAGGSLENARDWLERRKGYGVPRQKAEEWWARARAEGEEAYAVARVLPATKRGQEGWPSMHLLELLSTRHPQRLPEIYRQLLEKRPELQSWPVVRAIGQSRLGHDAKVELVLLAQKHASFEHRRAALFELSRIAPARFAAALLSSLKALPRTPKGPYWKAPEGAFANLAMESSDPAVWQALLEAARRADVGLRMALLNPMDYTYVGARQRRQRLAFLAAFLDDSTLRDVASDRARFEGPHAGFTFPRLRVQDLVTLKLASLLGLEPRPEPSWTVAQWDALRARVRSALPR